MQEFSKVDPEYIAARAWHAGMNGETSQILHNFGHDKLVEEVHQQSVWTVLAVNHILGKLLISPATGQCEAWSASRDERASYVWWTLPMACHWGRDKGYKLYR